MNDLEKIRKLDYGSAEFTTKARSAIPMLLDKLDKCKEALEFYGHKKNWYTSTSANDLFMTIASKDTEGTTWHGGRKARLCLKEVFGEKK